MASLSDAQQLMAGATRLRFAPALEAQFRADSYDKSIIFARAALVALMLMWASFGVLDFYAMPVSIRTIWTIRFGIVFPLWVAVVVWSFFPGFQRVMQPAIAFLVFTGGTAIAVMTAIAQPEELGSLLYYSGLILAPLCGYSFLQLRFRYATAANLAVMLVYIGTALSYQDILAQPQGATILINNLFFVVGANLAGMATCYSLEFSARRAFVANFLLEQERLGEQRKRERTEAMLHILSQAIGGVVHDLGNPLTSVQTGVETLSIVLDRPEPDAELTRELLGFIDRGAQMLNVLRLSLMEQTRVLEGQPTPLDLHSAQIRTIIESGERYQNPRYRANRQLTMRGDDCEIVADEMKLVTVWMNLIGNALKYSDGEVVIEWHVENGRLFVAVFDQGRAGQGISREQAQQLFVPFGRLESHAEVEGTGLGLLSARQVVAAHGGEVWIEGTLDGTPDAAPFSTALGDYSPILRRDFRTAFVVMCPLAPPAHFTGSSVGSSEGV